MINKKNFFFFTFIIIGIILTVSYKNYVNNKYENILYSVSYDPFFVKEENLDHFNSYKFIFPKSINGKDVHGYLINADYILKKLNNHNNIIDSQPFYLTSFFQPNIIALFAYFTNQSIFIIDNNGVKNFSLKVDLLIYLQIFLFYGSLILLFTELIKHLNGNLVVIYCSLIAIEPSIMQWNISLMTESLSFSILLLIFYFLLKPEIKYSYFVGFLLGLFFLQRTMMIYYFPLILIYYFTQNKKIILKVIDMMAFLISFCAMIALLAYVNHARTGKIFLMPLQAKLHISHYLEHKIIALSKGVDKNKIHNILQARNEKIIKDNNLNLKIENDKIEYANLVQKKSYETVLKYPFTSIKLIFSKIHNAIILDPLHMINIYTKFNNYNDWKKSKDRKINFAVRIIYSLFIYTLALLGFLHLLKSKITPIYIFSFLNILFFSGFGALAFANSQRYFVPALIFLLIFSSNGLLKIYEKKK